MAAQGEADLIADLAYPLPVTVIAELLGIPASDHDQFHVWSDALARSLDLIEAREVYEKASVAAAELTDYLRGIVAQRRGNLRDDLLSALIAAEEAGDHLTAEELYATCALLLVAGHETTINLIGNGTLALLQNPAARQQLQNDPALIKTAVEELLRFDSPVQMTSRMAFETFELRGQTIRQGQQVAFLFGAANHDPERFADPGQLNLSRDPNPHLAFGNGIHYCLGAPLARLEGQIALSTLVRRFPNLQLAAETPVYRDNYVLRGLEILRVTF
jgi:cytochrome P450